MVQDRDYKQGKGPGDPFRFYELGHIRVSLLVWKGGIGVGISLFIGSLPGGMGQGFPQVCLMTHGKTL